MRGKGRRALAVRGGTKFRSGVRRSGPYFAALFWLANPLPLFLLPLRVAARWRRKRNSSCSTLTGASQVGTTPGHPSRGLPHVLTLPPAQTRTRTATSSKSSPQSSGSRSEQTRQQSNGPTTCTPPSNPTHPADSRADPLLAGRRSAAHLIKLHELGFTREQVEGALQVLPVVRLELGLRREGAWS